MKRKKQYRVLAPGRRTGKVDLANIGRVSVLMKALDEWDSAFASALEDSKTDAVEINVGRLEKCGSDDVVQPEASVIIDTMTGAVILAQARMTIVEHLAALGVTISDRAVRKPK